MPRDQKPFVVGTFYGYPAELVARWCGVSLSTTRAWKAGRRKPSRQALRGLPFTATNASLAISGSVGALLRVSLLIPLATAPPSPNLRTTPSSCSTRRRSPHATQNRRRTICGRSRREAEFALLGLSNRQQRIQELCISALRTEYSRAIRSKDTRRRPLAKHSDRTRHRLTGVTQGRPPATRERPQDAGALGAKDGPRRPWMAAVQVGAWMRPGAALSVDDHERFVPIAVATRLEFVDARAGEVFAEDLHVADLVKVHPSPVGDSA